MEAAALCAYAYNRTWQVLVDACWALSYLSEPPERVQVRASKG